MMNYEELAAGFAEKVFGTAYRPECTYFMRITPTGVLFYYREPDSSEYKPTNVQVPLDSGSSIEDEEKEDLMIETSRKRDSCLWSLIPQLILLLLVVCLVILIILFYGGFLT